MSPLWLLPFVSQVLLQWKCVHSGVIELLECPLPDIPQWGGYGPKQDYYVPGDVIHYFCDTDTYIGGQYYRRCEDNGDWSGNTPVCDTPARFSDVTQSSTAEPLHENDAESASDGARTTCSSTASGTGGTWTGTLITLGEAIRVMIFLPRGEVDYEVLAVRANGSELSCGTKRGRIERYEWIFHNCPGPHNHGVTAIKIKSLNNAALQLCEVITHVLTAPTCVDPHYVVDNGHFIQSRKAATLVCDGGFISGPDKRLECVRTGVWNRKSLYCIERQYELERDSPRSPGAEPLGGRQDNQ